MGWFYGFKLHMIINDNSQIIAVKITPGNSHDLQALESMVNFKNLTGKIYADKGYISQSLFEKLYKQGLTLITGIKRNMKNYLMPLIDKFRLRNRYIIETIFGYIKENFNLKPNKHRAPINFFVSLISSLIAFQISPSKPKISYP